MAAAKASSTKNSSKPASGKTKEKGSKLSALKSLLLGKEKKDALAKTKNTSEKGADKAKAAKGKPAAPAKAAAKPAQKAPVKDAKAAKGAPAAKAAAPAPAKGKAAAPAPAKGKAAAPAPAKGKAAAPASAPAKGKAAPAPMTAAVTAAKAAKGAAAMANALAKAKGGSPIPTKGRGRSDEQCCREVACEGLASSGGYCRLHYIKNWKKIKRKELILKEGKLIQYIEELVAKYPDKYIEAIRQDLAHDKDFAKVIYDLDLDEGVDEFDGDGENVDALIDNIKRDFEDEGEGF